MWSKYRFAISEFSFIWLSGVAVENSGEKPHGFGSLAMEVTSFPSSDHLMNSPSKMPIYHGWDVTQLLTGFLTWDRFIAHTYSYLILLSLLYCQRNLCDFSTSFSCMYCAFSISWNIVLFVLFATLQWLKWLTVTGLFCAPPKLCYG